MQIFLTESFQEDAKKLEISQREALFEVLLKLPTTLKDIHKHSGMGLRKIHPSGIYEARIGLKIRMVFGFQKNTLSLHRVGNHDDISRYLKTL